MIRLRTIGLILLVLAIVAPMLGVAGTTLGITHTYNETFKKYLDAPRYKKDLIATASAYNVKASIAAVRLASRDVISLIWTAAGFITGTICAVMGAVMVLLSGRKFQPPNNAWLQRPAAPGHRLEERPENH